MEKRSYTKHNNAYWEGRKSKQTVIVPPVTINNAPAIAAIETVPFPEISYGSCESPGSNTNIRGNAVNQPGPNPDSFSNLRSIPLPYYGYNGTRNTYIGASDAIQLCARAWAGVPVVRNAIEIAVEFSNQPLYLKCKNKTVKRFFQEWLRAAKVNSFKEEFFREYYRSGNVFMMTFEGKFGPAYYQNFQESFGAKENKVPIRYELLNPINIFIPVGLTAPYTYVQMLSTYEIQRLKNPLTEQDKQVYKDLPQVAKDQISQYSSSPLGIYVPLDSSRLRYVFYKKQSYEPLSVPMVWPVLPDIEWKLILKKQDKALIQNVERILLLITTGEAPNQWNGGKGINPNNIINLQNLLTNQTLNRVLVTDYSTKAQFIVPDLSGLSQEKYKQVNDDIKEGLQSILTGDDKFANAQIKAQIFIQRLNEGQSKFLDFLETEVQMICERMNFRDKPELFFKQINLQDASVLNRVYAQLAQLGILTAKQTINAVETNVLPDADEMDEAQIEYTKDRDAGKYYPLVGGSQPQDEGAAGGQAKGPGGRPAGSKAPQTSKRVGPIGTGSAETPLFSLKAVVETMKARSNLEETMAEELKKHYKIKELNEAQMNAVGSLCFGIMATQPKDKWESKAMAKKAIRDCPAVTAEIIEELDEIRQEFRLRDNIEALVVKNSRIEKK